MMEIGLCGSRSWITRVVQVSSTTDRRGNICSNFNLSNAIVLGGVESGLGVWMLPHTVSPTVKLTRAWSCRGLIQSVSPSTIFSYKFWTFGDLNKRCKCLIHDSRGVIHVVWGIVESSPLNTRIEITKKHVWICNHGSGPSQSCLESLLSVWVVGCMLVYVDYIH